MSLLLLDLLGRPIVTCVLSILDSIYYVFISIHPIVAYATLFRT